MRIDVFLHRVRFARSRAKAQAMISEGTMRCNSARVLRPSCTVKDGDILTFVQGETLVQIQIDSLPDRRGPASEAQSCYHVLDHVG